MYQWTAKTLGKQAAKTLGKKVLDEAGDIAIGAALKELGLQSDPTAEMKKALAEMNGKLDMLLTELSQVTKNIDSLRSELKFSTSELKNVVEAVGIRLACDSIQRAYNGGRKASGSRPTVQSEQVSAAFVSPITSLAEAVRRRMAGETIPKGAIDEFCRNILVEWDLPTKVVAIRTALEGDASTGGSPGLLSSWVELSTLKMGKGKKSPDLLKHYKMLEQNFLYYLGIQLEGALLVMNAKSYGSSTAGDDYFNNEFRPLFLELLEVFLQRVESLVMSQSDFRSPSPLSVNPVDSSDIYPFMGLPPDIDSVLLRSYLLTRYLMKSLDDTDYAGDSKGVYVHLFCRERDLVDGKGPLLQLIKGAGQTWGWLVAGAGNLAPRWGSSGDNYARLLEPDEEKDRVRVVRYFWGYRFLGPLRGESALKGEKPEALSPLYDLDKRGFCVDLSTLELYQNDDSRYKLPNEIQLRLSNLQNFMDFTRLTVPTALFDNPIAADTSITKSAVEGLSSTMHPVVKNNVTTNRHILRPKPYIALEAEFEIEQEQSSDYHLMQWHLTAPLFQYEGRKERTLRIHLWPDVLFYRRGFDGGRGRNPILMAAQLNIGLRSSEGDRWLFNSHEYENGRLNLWKMAPTNSPSEYAAPRLEFSISLKGGTGTQRYDLLLNFFVHHELEKRGRNNIRSSAGIRLLLKDVSFSWD